MAAMMMRTCNDVGPCTYRPPAWPQHDPCVWYGHCMLLAGAAQHQPCNPATLQPCNPAASAGPLQVRLNINQLVEGTKGVAQGAADLGVQLAKDTKDVAQARARVRVRVRVQG